MVLELWRKIAVELIAATEFFVHSFIHSSTSHPNSCLPTHLPFTKLGLQIFEEFMAEVLFLVSDPTSRSTRSCVSYAV